MDLIITILLGLSLFAFWLPLPPLVPGLLAVAAAAVGAYEGIFSPLALFALLVLFLFSLAYFKGKRPLFLALALALLCWLLSKNWIPGFYNWKAFPRIRLAPDSAPFNLFFNFDKSFVGIALLLFLGPLKPLEIVKRLKEQWPIVLGCFVALLGSSLAFSYVHVDIKVTAIAPFWLINNFFFVCMPEEALFRGFIQKELNDKPWAALAASSLLFGVYHANWGALMVLFGTIAGLFYGYIWMRTKRLEASMALHFLVNTIHFFFFSYPRAYT